MRKLLACGVQLLEESLETTTDASERRRALLLQLTQQVTVLPSRLVDVHVPIFRETSSPDKCGASGVHSSGKCVCHHSRACSCSQGLRTRIRRAMSRSACASCGRLAGSFSRQASIKSSSALGTSVSVRCDGGIGGSWT